MRQGAAQAAYQVKYLHIPYYTASHLNKIRKKRDNTPYKMLGVLSGWRLQTVKQ
jgi:hypothetical protein